MDALGQLAMSHWMSIEIQKNYPTNFRRRTQLASIYVCHLYIAISALIRSTPSTYKVRMACYCSVREVKVMRDEIFQVMQAGFIRIFPFLVGFYSILCNLLF
ncbi:uncharacterized protein A4U43_C03F27290, partial [Asparagus officinalis]